MKRQAILYSYELPAVWSAMYILMGGKELERGERVKGMMERLPMQDFLQYCRRDVHFYLLALVSTCA